MNFVNSKFCRRFCQFVDEGVLIHGGSQKKLVTIQRSQFQSTEQIYQEVVSNCVEFEVEKFDGRLILACGE